MQITIRAAKCADADTLTKLARRSKASWDYPKSWIREWDEQLSFSPEYIAGNEVFVAVSDLEVIGVIALEQGIDHELSHLWIAPEHQNQGIGRRLVEYALETARRLGWQYLRIESDPNARPFYERLGAIPVGEVNAPVAGTTRVLPVLCLFV